MAPNTSPPADDLSVPSILLLAAYAGALAIALSEVMGVWSAMHSLVTACLVIIGGPLLLGQAVLFRARRARSAEHQRIFWLSLALPTAIGVAMAVVMLTDS